MAAAVWRNAGLRRRFRVQPSQTTAPWTAPSPAAHSGRTSSGRRQCRLLAFLRGLCAPDCSPPCHSQTVSRTASAVQVPCREPSGPPHPSQVRDDMRCGCQRSETGPWCCHRHTASSWTQSLTSPQPALPRLWRPTHRAAGRAEEAACAGGPCTEVQGHHEAWAACGALRSSAKCVSAPPPGAGPSKAQWKLSFLEIKNH